MNLRKFPVLLSVAALCVAGCSKNDDFKTLVEVKGGRAAVNLNYAADAAEVAAVIADADAQGVTHYLLKGEFAKLGIKRVGTSPDNPVGVVNPFRGTNAEVIDFSRVTGWPDVNIDEGTVVKGMPDNSFHDDGAIFGEPYYPRLKHVVFPSAVKGVGVNAFRGVLTLEKVTAPGFTLVGPVAFAHCESLPEVDFPNVKTVKFAAFMGCSSLSKVNLPNADIVEYESFLFCRALARLRLPAAVFIGQHCFWECGSLAELDLPDAVTVETPVFFNCGAMSLLKLTAPGELNMDGDLFSGAEDTKNCALVLNQNKRSEVRYKQWRGRTWKSIAFE